MFIFIALIDYCVESLQATRILIHCFTSKLHDKLLSTAHACKNCADVVKASDWLKMKLITQRSKFGLKAF